MLFDFRQSVYKILFKANKGERNEKNCIVGICVVGGLRYR